MSSIKAVVYDFGGVLLSYDEAYYKWIEMDKALGLEPGTIHREATGSKFSDWLGPSRNLFQGKLTVDELESGVFVEYLKTQFPDHVHDGVQIKPFTAVLRGSNARFYQNMLNTITTLRSHGFKTALLTNNMYLDKEHKEVRLPMDLSVFDEVIESCIEGVMKPSQRIYKIVEERLNLKGEEILFLDDLEENIEAAKKLGWNTIKVGRNINEAIKEITRLTNVCFDN